MKPLNQTILSNLTAELNMCKAKQSVLKQKNMRADKLEDRIAYLEREITELRKNINEGTN